MNDDCTSPSDSMDRRRILLWLAGSTIAPAFGCGGGAPLGAGSTTTGGDESGRQPCSRIPEETAGPFPADGSNGPNLLAALGIVRSDIRPSFGAMTGTAEGIPIRVQLRVVNAGGCSGLVGRAVYLWHCDRDGKYSVYTVTDQNYLRGLQQTDDDGNAFFTTIFPGCYPGRWPHMHFEVFTSLDEAMGGALKLATSQLALPKVACEEVYATSGYEPNLPILAQTSLSSDGVFRDGSSGQIATIEGNVMDGYVARLTIPVVG